MSIKRDKPRLSKSILDMKFMKRTKVQVDKEAEETESRNMYAQEITQKMRNNATNFITESSFMLCEGLQEGRFSFRGMNPEIERIMEEEQQAKKAAIKHVQSTDVSDADMAKFYYAQQAPAAHKTMQRKFERNVKKRKNTDNNHKKTKFLKSKNED